MWRGWQDDKWQNGRMKERWQDSGTVRWGKTQDARRKTQDARRKTQDARCRVDGEIGGWRHFGREESQSGTEEEQWDVIITKRKYRNWLSTFHSSHSIINWMLDQLLQLKPSLNMTVIGGGDEIITKNDKWSVCWERLGKEGWGLGESWNELIQHA